MKPWELSSGFCVSTRALPDVDEYLREAMTNHHQLGLASVDVSFGLIDSMGEDYPAYVERAMKLGEELGIRFGVGHLPFVSQKVGLPKGDEFAQRVRRCLDAFKMMGVDFAVMHPNSASLLLTDFDETAEYDNVMRFMSPFAEYAHQIGQPMVIENMRSLQKEPPVHRYCSAPHELCRVADALGIGVCWDTGHAHISGLVQSEALSYVGDRLKMLHLNDNFGGEDVHLPLFYGSVDWADVVKGLAAVNYQGYLNFELSTWALPDELKLTQGELIVSAGRLLQQMLAKESGK